MTHGLQSETPTSRSRKQLMESSTECATGTSSLPVSASSLTPAQTAPRGTSYFPNAKRIAAVGGENGASTATKGAEVDIHGMGSVENADSGGNLTHQREGPGTSCLFSALTMRCKTLIHCATISQRLATTSSGAWRSLSAQSSCPTSVESCARLTRRCAPKPFRIRACQLPSSSLPFRARTTTMQSCSEQKPLMHLPSLPASRTELVTPHLNSFTFLILKLPTQYL